MVEMKGESIERKATSGANGVFLRKSRIVEYRKWWSVKSSERSRNDGAPI